MPNMGFTSRNRIMRHVLPLVLLLLLPTAAVFGLKFRTTAHNPFVAPPPGGPQWVAANRLLMKSSGFALLPRNSAAAAAAATATAAALGAASSSVPVASILSSCSSLYHHNSGGIRRMSSARSLACNAAASSGAEGSAKGGWRGLLSAFRRGGVGGNKAGRGGAAAAPSNTLTTFSSSYAAWAFGGTLAQEGGILSFLPPGIPTDIKGIEVALDGGGVRGEPMRSTLMAAAGGKRKKKVLILMSDTGGGHRASAQALEAAFNELFPNQVECSTVDIWTDFAPWPYNRFVPAYQFMAKNPLYWKAFWEYGKFPPSKWGTEELSNLACHHRFKDCIESQDPDLIISVHPLCQDVPLRVLNTMGSGRRQIPFVTVVTDLGGAHPTWFHKEVDLCFVPSDPVRKIALSMGLQNDQIRQHGLPIRPGFWRAGKDKVSLRKELGLLTGARTALVVGGGDGIGNLLEITENLAKSLSAAAAATGGPGGEGGKKSQVVVVCGKNEEMRRDLERKVWPESVSVVVKGFVNNMDAWMGASDCIVTKAGPGTIAEASTRGLPVMLFNYLPGQEEGNVPFVVDNGFGDYKKDPKAIGKVVSGWMMSEEVRGRLSKKALEASRPSSTTDIAKEIGDLLFGDWQLPRRKDTEDKFNVLLKKLMEPVTM